MKNRSQPIQKAKYRVVSSKIETVFRIMNPFGTGQNLGNGTGDQEIVVNINADNDSSCSGYLHLFNPSDTTFVKHFISRMNSAGESHRSFGSHTAGYINTAAAVTAVRFTFGGSNIDAGDICLYGIN